MKTLRERIIDLLMEYDGGLSVGEVIYKLDLDPKMEKEVLATIKKIPKALKKKGLRLLMIPPRCKSCGFEFSKPKATRCPKCKGQRIEEAVFVLKF